MKGYNAFISDKKCDENYISFETYGLLAFWYSRDPQNGACIKLYIDNLPSFHEVYDYFMNCKFPGLKFNKLQDVCLSLFFNPYFEEFYKVVIKDINQISISRLKFLKKFMLEYLANPIYASFNGKDRCLKAQEMLILINNKLC